MVDINPIEAAKSANEALKQHGLSVMLTIVLIAVLIYFAYSQYVNSKQQTNRWQEIQAADIGQLRKELQTERDFIRGKFLETIDNNSEALRGLTDELRDGGGT